MCFPDIISQENLDWGEWVLDSTTSMHFGLPRAKCRVEHTELTLMRVQLGTRRYIDTFKSDGTFSTKAFSCLVENVMH